MLANFSRKSDKYGNVHFISLVGTILSRLAYCNDNMFLKRYMAIFGPVIPSKFLQEMDSVSSNNLEKLLDDEDDYKLSTDTSVPSTSFQNKKYIDWIKLNIPQQVNIINGEIKGTLPVTQSSDSSSVKYISIGWSNYGEVYVVADKNMPNTIFIIFRGTYSAKTAALYLKLISIVPLTTCKDSNGNPETFLYGIFKPTTELMHTILEATRYLAVNHLNATEPNSVKVFTTGHSLGGAMSTIFSYLWMEIKKTSPYNKQPYTVLSDNIICISIGSPRCMGKSVAQKFCKFVEDKKILYLRVTTRGDPVPALPKTGYEHACSSNEAMRAVVSEDCNSELKMRGTVSVDYQGDIDCQNYKTRTYIPNMLSHTIYLDILFLSAVDIVNFLQGIGSAKEVSRNNGSTVCRVIMSGSQEPEYKVAFFDVDKARQNQTPSDSDFQEETTLNQQGGLLLLPQTRFSSALSSASSALSSASSALSSASSAVSNSAKNLSTFGGKVKEDVRMTKNAFDNLVGQMKALTGDLCPMEWKPYGLINPFTNELAPDLSCPSSPVPTSTQPLTQPSPQAAGRRKSKKMKKTKKMRKTYKSKKQKRQTKRRNKKNRK
jgi:hypothetical protein